MRASLLLIINKDEIIRFLAELWEQIITYVRNMPAEQVALISLGVALVSLIIGILTLFYAAKAYHLQWDMFRTARDLDEKKEHEAEKERNDLKAADARKVPDTITFGYDVLIVPEFEELGIPTDIAKLFHLESRFKIGDWIKLGDELLTASFSIFSMYDKPPRWLSWMDRPRLSSPIPLYSPVNGLIIGFNIHRYYTKSLFPIILLPSDEPSQTSHCINFYESAIRHLDDNWTRIACGYDRLIELDSKPVPETIDKLPLSKFQVGNVLKAFRIKRITEEEKEILPYIKELCKERLDLRPKIKHLNFGK